MTRLWRRLLWLVAALVATVVLLAIVYAAGMHWLEGRPRSFWAALVWSAETLTTTGYGADYQWAHPLMAVFVSLTQFVGIFLVFLVFPIYLIPLLEERFEVRIPRSLKEAEDHVVVYRHGPAVAGVMQDLEAEGRRVVLVEPDDGPARSAAADGIEVMIGSADERTLRAAKLDAASALVANGSDDENAALVVAARQQGFEGRLVSMVADPNHRRAIELAGATAVVSPKRELGAALAHRASPKAASTGGLFSCGPELRIESISVPADGRFAGRRLEEVDLGRRWKVSAVAQWVGGRLLTDLSAESRIEAGGTLVVAGSGEAIEALRTEINGSAQPRTGYHVVGGFGEVGRRVVDLLRLAGEEVLVIDRQGGDGVDLAADLLDQDTLDRAELERATSVVLALDSDASTLFATLLVRNMAPQTPLVARVNDARNLDNIHRAGASYAVSLDQVAGQILAAHLLDEESVTLDPRLRVLRLRADRLAGSNLAGVDLRQRTGSTIIAVERGDDLHVDLAPEFDFSAGDIAYVCGSPAAVRQARDWLLASK